MRKIDAKREQILQLLDTIRQMNDHLPVRMAIDILKETIIYHEGDVVSSEAKTYLRNRMMKLEGCIEKVESEDPWKRLRKKLIGV